MPRAHTSSSFVLGSAKTLTTNAFDATFTNEFFPLYKNFQSLPKQPADTRNISNCCVEFVIVVCLIRSIKCALSLALCCVLQLVSLAFSVTISATCTSNKGDFSKVYRIYPAVFLHLPLIREGIYRRFMKHYTAFSASSKIHKNRV